MDSIRTNQEENNNEFIKKISNLSFSQSLSSKSSLVDSLKTFPSFLSCFVYSLTETNLILNFDEIKNLILNFVKNDQKYIILYLLNESFQCIKNNNIQFFKQIVMEIQRIFDKINKEKYSLLNISNLNENDIIFQNNEIIKNIFNNVLFIRKIIPNISNLNEDGQNNKTYRTEDEVIKAIDETLEKEPKIIKEIYDLFFFKNIKYVSDNEFKYKFKYGFHFIINDILKDSQLSNDITLNDCFDYFYKKEKIYLPAEIMIIIIDNDDSNYKVKFEKEIQIKLYDGTKQFYKFGGIIMEIDFQSKLIISESLDGKKWKKFNNIIVDNVDLNYERLSQPSLLFYKKM